MKTILALMLLFCSQAQGAMLWLQQTAVDGDQLSVDLMIGELNDAAGQRLSGFDLDVAFDSSVLSLLSFSYTSMLGEVNIDALPGLDGENQPGVLSLSLVSLFWADLSVQTRSFALASLVFDISALPTASSTWLNIGSVRELLDQDSQLFQPETVTNLAVTAVSEPASTVLFMLASAFLLVRLRQSCIHPVK
ncbi:hypothetical protein KJY73_07275 [Bowmanella sp. Y26]|uniref:hypothetical protein n=1 Tax=Bowmanella yangjiangensis TaxID=2811230 RepID=UPI001BDCD024|nr:hypothetical protein [Bowmanella yangjiangensis]MBT1063370.1 hypothetical protein [Bowmanella yangjiangensis]